MYPGKKLDHNERYLGDGNMLLFSIFFNLQCKGGCSTSDLLCSPMAAIIESWALLKEKRINSHCMTFSTCLLQFLVNFEENGRIP